MEITEKQFKALSNNGRFQIEIGRVMKKYGVKVISFPESPNMFFSTEDKEEIFLRISEEINNSLDWV